MSTTRNSQKTTDRLITELGYVRFSLRGHMSRTFRTRMQAKEAHLATELKSRGLTDKAIAAIR